MINFSGDDILYDEIGNPLQYRDGMAFVWQYGRRLASVSQGSNAYTYSYDASGVRLAKTINGSSYNYIYDNGSLLYADTPLGGMTFIYDNDSVIGYKYNSSYYFYLKNLQGDILGAVDASGNLLYQYRYDAWGVPTVLDAQGNPISPDSAHIANANPLRYRGYFFDSETGFYYLLSRYYDPETGRFINADELIDNGTGILGYNMYTYCINNPVNMVDVDGNAPAYISSQENNTMVKINGKMKRMRDIRWGWFGNIASNGCGVIAAYNVLLSRSSKTDFGKVKNQLSSYGGALGFGKLGVDPYALTMYMRSKFWFVQTAGASTYWWGIKAELSQSVIVLIKWGGGLSMHYIAGIGTGQGDVGGSFKFYNSYLYDKKGNSIDGKTMSIWTFIDYVKSNGATPVYFIGVSGKKGWW